MHQSTSGRVSRYSARLPHYTRSTRRSIHPVVRLLPQCGYSYFYRDLMRHDGAVTFSHDVQVDEYVDPNNLVDYVTLARINGEMITDERYTSTTPASLFTTQNRKGENSQTLLRHESHTRRPYVCPLYLSCHPRQYRTLYCIDPLSGRERFTFRGILRPEA